MQIYNKHIFDPQGLGVTSIQCRLNRKIFALYEYKLTYNSQPQVTLPGPLVVSVSYPSVQSGHSHVYNAFLNAGYKMHGHHDSNLIDIDTFLKYYHFLF